MSDEMRWGREFTDSAQPSAGPGGTPSGPGQGRRGGIPVSASGATESEQGNQGKRPGEAAGGAGADQGSLGNGQMTPRYSHYQIHQEQRMQLPPPEGRPPRNNRGRGDDFSKKAGATIALAVIFGLVAGLVFQGVNVVSRRYLGTGQQSQLGMTNTIPDSSTAVQSSAEGENLDNLLAQSGTVAGVAQAAMPSVVAITSVSIQEIRSFFGFYARRAYPTTGTGSGIIVGENDDELLIATNNHVVEDATTLSVCFIGDDVISAEEETQNLAAGIDGDINIEDAVTAKIKGTDADNDLAVIAVNKSDIPDDTMSQIKIAQLGSSDDLVVGEQVVAIGNALGYGQSVTSGWISALNRSIAMENGASAELIQTDAAINPGNSGGALLNLRGELIGINSAKYADNAVEGMGYAIPISKAKPILEELMNRKTRDVVEGSQAAYLGVKVSDLSVEAIQMYNMPAGALVTSVTPGDPAAEAGIHKGDIVVKMDGQKVSGRDDLLDKLQYYAAGEVVTFVVSRADTGQYQETSIDVTLGARTQ